MRVHVVSDVHGRTDALARAGAGADVLICLGDLVLYVDYHDHSAGIMADLFGAEAVTRLIELRTARRFDEARTWSRGLWAHFDADPRVVLEAAIRRQYAEMFAVLPTPTFITYGNVDVPALWPEFARPGVHVLDGEVAEIGGLRVGFVGGGLHSPMRTPYELSEDDYAAKAGPRSARLTCSAATSRRPYRSCSTHRGAPVGGGSGAVLEAIWDTAPRLVLFGHVHQPLVTRTRIGRTECVNVGHFRTRRTPYVLDWAG